MAFDLLLISHSCQDNPSFALINSVFDRCLRAAQYKETFTFMSKQIEEVAPAVVRDAPPLAQGMTATRRQLLAMATATCGVTVAASLFNPARADLVAKIGKLLYLDPTVLNFAFEMEELQQDFYSRIPRSKGWGYLSGQERNILSLMAQQDSEHFTVLNAARDALGYQDAGNGETINSFASRRPRMFTYSSLNSREDLLNVALDVKETVLFGYHGAVGVVRNKEILKTAAAIAGVEGRHAAILRQAIGLNPVPASFEGAYAAQHTGYKLAKYGFKGGAPR